MRRLERVIARYPRAFDLVLAEGLYATAPFFNFLTDRRKHVLCVLKDERRNLYQDAVGLFSIVAPTVGSRHSRQCHWNLQRTDVCRPVTVSSPAILRSLLSRHPAVLPTACPPMAPSMV